jgi:hypothetical protein
MTVNKRVGKFTLPAGDVQAYEPSVLRVMGLCAVGRAERMFEADVVEYTAVCEMFREISPGEIVPRYRWIVGPNDELRCEEVTQ